MATVGYGNHYFHSLSVAMTFQCLQQSTDTISTCSMQILVHIIRGKNRNMAICCKNNIWHTGPTCNECTIFIGRNSQFARIKSESRLGESTTNPFQARSYWAVIVHSHDHNNRLQLQNERHPRTYCNHQNIVFPQFIKTLHLKNEAWRSILFLFGDGSTWIQLWSHQKSAL